MQLNLPGSTACSGVLNALPKEGLKNLFLEGNLRPEAWAGCFPFREDSGDSNGLNEAKVRGFCNCYQHDNRTGILPARQDGAHGGPYA